MGICIFILMGNLLAEVFTRSTESIGFSTMTDGWLRTRAYTLTATGYTLIKTAVFFWTAAERIQIPLILSRKEIPLFQMMILNQLPIFSFLDLERMYRRMLLIRGLSLHPSRILFPDRMIRV